MEVNVNVSRVAWSVNVMLKVCSRSELSYEISKVQYLFIYLFKYVKLTQQRKDNIIVDVKVNVWPGAKQNIGYVEMYDGGIAKQIFMIERERTTKGLALKIAKDD
jgi:hypothetical protein